MSLFSVNDPWMNRKKYEVTLQTPDLESGVAPRRDTTYTPDSSGRKPNLPPLRPKQSTSENQHTQNSSTVSSTGAGNGQYMEQLNSLYNQIMNRGQFKYDLNGDMLYRQMADQYTQLGRQAMMDTIGQAATSTGGYGNSYGTTAGNQAYQQYLTALNNNIPDLYDRALASWQAQGDELLKQYQLAAQHQATLDALKPRTVYATKKKEAPEEETQDETGVVDPSYLNAVKAFLNGQATGYMVGQSANPASALNGPATGYMVGQSANPSSATQQLNNFIGNVEGMKNPLPGFYEKNYESMKTGGTNQTSAPAAPTNGSIGFQLPIQRMDYEILKDKYMKK